MDAIQWYDRNRYYPTIHIGDRVSVSDDVHISCSNKITIGNDVLIGSHVYVSDHDHGIYQGEDRKHSNPNQKPAERLLTADGYVKIGDRVHIGEYAAIMKNVSIGCGSIVGAHTVVVKDVPEDVIVVGNPARIVKRYNSTTGFWVSE